MCCSISHPRPCQITGTIIDFFPLCFTDFVQNRRWHRWWENRRLLLCKQWCLEDVLRAQMHGKDCHGIAGRSGHGWDALCAILDARGFMPGPPAVQGQAEGYTSRAAFPIFPEEMKQQCVLAKLREQEIWSNFKFSHSSILDFSIIKSSALPKALSFMV